MYRELYSRFKDSIKVYTEKLDVSEMGFMALLTEGMHVFQRETGIWDKYIVLHRISGKFYVPSDLMVPVWLKKETGETILPLSIEQLETKRDQHEHFASPYNYDKRLASEHKPQPNSSRDTYPIDSSVYAIFMNELKVRKYDGDLLQLKYKPYFEPMGFDSPYWNVWSPSMVVGTDLPTSTVAYKVLNGEIVQTLITYYQGQIFISDGSVLTTTTGYANFAPENLTESWYYKPNFMNVFTTKSVPRVFKPYKVAFLDYSIFRYLMSLGMVNHGMLYKQMFDAEVIRTKKLTLFNRGTLDYQLVM
jgi:hypothetical protein